VPDPAQIRDGLGALANGASALAVAWHAVLLAAGAALLLGWRPSVRTAGLLLSAPLLSVAAAAFAWDNRFNGTVFLAIGGLQAATAARMPSRPATRGAPWAQGAGLALVAAGWAYPHFLESVSALTYLYAAPTGVIPCPTLALVAGVSLVLDGLGSRRWALVLAAAAAFYGLVGALRLGVGIDLVLPAGAVALGVQALNDGRRNRAVQPSVTAFRRP
jgi:hypothetical protein